MGPLRPKQPLKYLWCSSLGADVPQHRTYSADECVLAVHVSETELSKYWSLVYGHVIVL
jgi:hypothetical protein